MEYEQLFLDSLGLIDQVVRFVGRRHHLSVAELDDLRGLVHLKLVERDYAVLRTFQGRSSLSTFLTTVISRLFLDERTARWGKWRPSAAARRHGNVAVWLEQLMSRDGLRYDAAVEALRTNHHVAETDAELAEIRRWVSVRTRRREASEDELEDVAAIAPPVDEALHGAARTALAERVRRALEAAIRGLEPQEVLVLKMRFLDGFQVSQIARTLRVEQKPLYRRIEQLLQRLSVALEAEGLVREDVLAIVGGHDVDIGSVF